MCKGPVAVNMKMRINENENKKYQEIARLVDSPDFLNEILELREKLHPPGKIIPYSDFQLCVDLQMYYIRTPEEEDHVNHLVDRKEMMESQGIDTFNLKEYEDIEVELAIYADPKKSFYFDVRRIKNLFGLPDTYMALIAKAVLCNEVHGDDLNIPFRGKNPSEIRKHRDWYWLNKKAKGDDRLGYGKIADKETVAISTVQKAIERYEESFYRITQ
jgi:hypothetical protein